jgi:hypothetical protein
MDDKELRIRAMTAPKEDADGRGPSPRLHALIQEVDSIEGDPTPEQIRELAYKYYETPEVVEMIVEARSAREKGKARPEIHKSSWGVWLPEELDLLRSMFNEHKGESLRDLDAEIADALNALPANKKRGIQRTPSAVEKRRKVMGLTIVSGLSGIIGEIEAQLEAERKERIRLENALREICRITQAEYTDSTNVTHVFEEKDLPKMINVFVQEVLEDGLSFTERIECR